MSRLLERLAEMRRHLDHLHALRPKVKSAMQLSRDLSLHNDVLFSLLTLCQLVIDVSGELASRKKRHFEDYTGAIRALTAYDEISDGLITDLERLPGFRNILVHEYLALDLDRAIEALDHLEPIEAFLGIVCKLCGDDLAID